MMRQFRIHRLGALLLGSALAVLLSGVVLAHAQLKTPSPADKSTSTQPVTVVTGIFTQRVKADGSKLVVKLVGGATVAQGGVDPSNDLKMVATPATPLGSGSYLVEWTTISLDDGELARGTWTFTVAVAATPSSTPTPSAAASSTPGATATPPASVAPSVAPPSAGPTPVPSAGGDTTGSNSDVILPIIVALIVLGAGAAYLLSRRNRPTSTT